MLRVMNFVWPELGTSAGEGSSQAQYYPRTGVSALELLEKLLGNLVQGNANSF